MILNQSELIRKVGYIHLGMRERIVGIIHDHIEPTAGGEALCSIPKRG